ncbi:MAG: phosphate/phosphite/phosphonate ABC transporter substrate-binding protein [Myxococcaceae bacterium]|jgi:phosphonate transport system substrate-binding protein|nr:phosphate/phosphite/phosphonate ABC transporter substrate-binding protein [Myxococcaceae bacterium]MCA3015881.1 phosphate/phosphite/phosphonate ABC transporter substrate-binding protein [Myxococcaceae bacterium]
MPTSSPPRSRASLRFALPPTLAELEARSAALAAYLTQTLGKPAEVVVPASYESLAKDLLSGKVDAAWAPPFVCARIEAMGVRVLVRGVRSGVSTYRAALLCRADSNVTRDSLKGTTAAWSDRDSVGGYLLPMAWLREQGFDPTRLFFRQDFVGNYRAALEQVARGTVDVTSVFAPAGRAGVGDATGVSEVWPGHEGDFRVLAFTDESPNDGVAVSMALSGPLVTGLEQALLAMKDTEAGAQVLKALFHAERFEPAPRMGYRALYRVALASL